MKDNVNVKQKQKKGRTKIKKEWEGTKKVKENEDLLNYLFIYLFIIVSSKPQAHRGIDKKIFFKQWPLL